MPDTIESTDKQTIVLIACCSRKRPTTSTANQLYISPLFIKQYRYAKHVLDTDNIYILSAKYGLVHQDQEIEPHDLKLPDLSVNERASWSNDIMRALRNISDIKKDRFIFLAGESYRKNIEYEFHDAVVPCAGMGIGNQMKWLGAQVDSALSESFGETGEE